MPPWSTDGRHLLDYPSATNALHLLRLFVLSVSDLRDLPIVTTERQHYANMRERTCLR